MKSAARAVVTNDREHAFRRQTIKALCQYPKEGDGLSRSIQLNLVSLEIYK
jgi:hypothetical protein